VLPENTLWWRTAEWRLGSALEASGGGRDALAAYVKSYVAQPDAERRQVIEALYKRLNNGSLQGLEQLIGPAPAPTLTQAQAGGQAQGQAPASPSTAAGQTADARELSKAATPAPREDASPTPPTASTAPEPTPTPEIKTADGRRTLPGPERPATNAEATPAPTATPTPNATPAPSPASSTPETTTQPAPSPTPEATPSPTPAAAATPTPEAAPTPTPEATPSVTPEATPTPTPSATPTPDATPTPQPSAAAEQKAGAGEGGACAVGASEESVTIKSNGGSATVALTLENYSGAAPPRVNPSTTNWADIIILAEPHRPEDGASMRFTVTSVSAKTGAFVVTFASPCGKREVTVNVK
jgi:hypothetical protein